MSTPFANQCLSGINCSYVIAQVVSLQAEGLDKSVDFALQLFLGQRLGLVGRLGRVRFSGVVQQPDLDHLRIDVPDGFEFAIGRQDVSQRRARVDLHRQTQSRLTLRRVVSSNVAMQVVPTSSKAGPVHR